MDPNAEEQQQTQATEEQQQDQQQQTDGEAQQTAEDREAEAAFAAGYNRVRGIEDETTDKEKPGDTETATSEASTDAPAGEQQEQPAADKAASAPAAEETVTLTKSQLEQINARLRNVEGNFGGLNSRMNQIVATAGKTAAAAGHATPTKSQVDAALQNPEKWKELKEDFPDWAGPMEAELLALHGTIAKIDPQAIAKQAAREAVQQVREETLSTLHPDWKQLDYDPAFNAWLDKNPKQKDKIVAAKGNVGVLGTVITDYKAHLTDSAKTRQQQTRRLARAVTPRGTSGQPTAGISDEAAFARGYNRVRKAAT